MNLAVKLGRSLQTDMQAELREIERVVVTGTRDTGRGLRTGLATAGDRCNLARSVQFAGVASSQATPDAVRASRFRRIGYREFESSAFAKTPVVDTLSAERSPR